MKKKLIVWGLVLCMLAMPVAVSVSSQPAYAQQKMIADFRSGITLKSHVTSSFMTHYLYKGDRIHVDATSTCAFLIGIHSLKNGENYGVSCVGACNKYITVPFSGHYRVFVYNKGTGKGTVKGDVYLVK